MQANADQIEELCTQIIAEKDPEKMVLLAKQLAAVIVEREQKLRKSLDRGVNGKGLRSFNAVCLQKAVLCADCDCVSDSPHDQCLVCGSRSLFSIARVLGGNLVRNGQTLIHPKIVTPKPKPETGALAVPKLHNIRRRIAA